MQRLSARPDAGAVYHLAFSPDGRCVVALDDRRSVLDVWDLAAGSHTTWPPNPPDGGIGCFAFEPGGKRMAVGGLRYWEFLNWPKGTPDRSRRRRTSVRRVVGGPGYMVEHLAFGPGNVGTDSWLAVFADTLDVWNRTTGQRVMLAAGVVQVNAVRVAPFGTEVAVIEAVGPAVVGRSIPGGAEVFRFPVRGPALQLHYTPDGDGLLVGAGAGVERRTPDGDCVWRAEIGEFATVTDFVPTTDGRAVLVAGGTPVVSVVEIESGQTVRAYDFGVDKVFAVAVSPDGLVAAAGGLRGHVAVWDLDG